MSVRTLKRRHRFHEDPDEPTDRVRREEESITPHQTQHLRFAASFDAIKVINQWTTLWTTPDPHWNADLRKPLILLARPAGLEPITF